MLEYINCPVYNVQKARKLLLYLTLLLTFVHRLRHSHHSEGGVRHVGSHHRGHHAA